MYYTDFKRSEAPWTRSKRFRLVLALLCFVLASVSVFNLMGAQPARRVVSASSLLLIATPPHGANTHLRNAVPAYGWEAHFKNLQTQQKIRRALHQQTTEAEAAGFVQVSTLPLAEQNGYRLHILATAFDADTAKALCHQAIQEVKATLAQHTSTIASHEPNEHPKAASTPKQTATQNQPGQKPDSQHSSNSPSSQTDRPTGVSTASRPQPHPSTTKRGFAHPGPGPLHTAAPKGEATKGEAPKNNVALLQVQLQALLTQQQAVNSQIAQMEKFTGASAHSWPALAKISRTLAAQSLLTQLTHQEAYIQQLETRYTEAHPTLLSAKALRTELHHQLKGYLPQALQGWVTHPHTLQQWSQPGTIQPLLLLLAQRHSLQQQVQALGQQINRSKTPVALSFAATVGATDGVFAMSALAEPSGSTEHTPPPAKPNSPATPPSLWVIQPPTPVASGQNHSQQFNQTFGQTPGQTFEQALGLSVLCGLLAAGLGWIVGTPFLGSNGIGANGFSGSTHRPPQQPTECPRRLGQLPAMEQGENLYEHCYQLAETLGLLCKRQHIGTLVLLDCRTQTLQDYDTTWQNPGEMTSTFSQEGSLYATLLAQCLASVGSVDGAVLLVTQHTPEQTHPHAGQQQALFSILQNDQRLEHVWAEGEATLYRFQSQNNFWLLQTNDPPDWTWIAQAVQHVGPALVVVHQYDRPTDSPVLAQQQADALLTMVDSTWLESKRMLELETAHHHQHIHWLGSILQGASQHKGDFVSV
ncbi:MAG: hypothetical protein SFZ03_06550 [Candidatus Melainabacteria bacterium]|nr:hypothetical protein [Candidatus Melainabacteria bacterium]